MSDSSVSCARASAVIGALSALSRGLSGGFVSGAGDVCTGAQIEFRMFPGRAFELCPNLFDLILLPHKAY